MERKVLSRTQKGIKDEIDAVIHDGQESLISVFGDNGDKGDIHG